MESFRVGELLVHAWPARPAAPAAGTPVAIAAHGITANGLSWARVAELLAGDVVLVAPDLRGRAGSRDAAGPYGIDRHADDLAAILDDLGVPQAVVAGHSMGAWVAAVAAVRHPGQVTGVVLVDGGLAFQPPPGPDPEAELAAFLGPAMARLEMTFPSRAAYREFWQAHPAFAGTWSPAIEAYVQHDLVGTGPFRSSCVVDAVRTDGAQIRDPQTAAAIHSLPAPGVFLYAERGLLDEPEAMYDEARVAGLEIPAVRLPGTNHYSILVGDRGAREVADRIRAFAR